jgi:hypothetical protein
LTHAPGTLRHKVARVKDGPSSPELRPFSCYDWFPLQRSFVMHHYDAVTVVFYLVKPIGCGWYLKRCFRQAGQAIEFTQHST